MLGYFLLLVAGFDNKGDFLGTLPIEKYPGVAEPDLDNAYSQGLFFVMAADIKTYSAEGTKPLFFVPKAYTPRGGTQKYVCYTIYDAPPHNGSFAGMVVVGSMNPSPPGNP